MSLENDHLQYMCCMLKSVFFIYVRCKNISSMFLHMLFRLRILFSNDKSMFPIIFLDK
jgi:hypothetical protein